jgi:hypothetical protein
VCEADGGEERECARGTRITNDSTNGSDDYEHVEADAH